MSNFQEEIKRKAAEDYYRSQGRSYLDDEIEETARQFGHKPIQPNPETQDNGFFDWVKDGIDTGFAGVLEGQARFVQANSPFGGDTAKQVGDYFGEVSKRNQRTKFHNAELSNPEYWLSPEGATYDVANTIGSAAALGAETAIAAKALALSPFAGAAAAVGTKIPALARLWQSNIGKMVIGNVAQTPLEAISEGGNLLTQMKAEGYSDDEIQVAVNKAAAGNVLFLGLSNLLQSYGATKLLNLLGNEGVKRSLAATIGLGVAGGAATQGAEEGAQTGIQYMAQGKEIDLDDLINSAKVGAVAGGALGGFGAGAGHIVKGSNQNNTNASQSNTDNVDPVTDYMQKQNTGAESGIDTATVEADKPNTSSNIVDNVRNLIGKIPYVAEDGTNCMRTMGIALQGTPFEGQINVDQAVATAQANGLLKEPSNYTPQAGDMAVVNDGNHIVMVTENGGTIQNGQSRNGVYEDSNSPESMFGGVKYYIQSSAYNSGNAGNQAAYNVQGNVPDINVATQFLQDNQYTFDADTNNIIADTLEGKRPESIVELYNRLNPDVQNKAVNTNTSASVESVNTGDPMRSSEEYEQDNPLKPQTGFAKLVKKVKASQGAKHIITKQGGIDVGGYSALENKLRASSLFDITKRAFKGDQKALQDFYKLRPEVQETLKRMTGMETPPVGAREFSPNDVGMHLVRNSILNKQAQTPKVTDNGKARQGFIPDGYYNNRQKFLDDSLAIDEQRRLINSVTDTGERLRAEQRLAYRESLMQSRAAEWDRMAQEYSKNKKLATSLRDSKSFIPEGYYQNKEAFLSEISRQESEKNRLDKLARESGRLSLEQENAAKVDSEKRKLDNWTKMEQEYNKNKKLATSLRDSKSFINLINKIKIARTEQKQKKLDYDWYMVEHEKATGKSEANYDDPIFNKAFKSDGVALITDRAISGDKSAQKAFQRMRPEIRQALLNRSAIRMMLDNERVQSLMYDDIAMRPFLPDEYYGDGSAVRKDKEMFGPTRGMLSNNAMDKQSGGNKKTTYASDGESGNVELADGYATESGRSLQDADSKEFIIKPDGSMDFGEITQDMEAKTNGVVKAGKIRLQVGFDRSGEGFGIVHIAKHIGGILQSGYTSAEEYVGDIAQKFNKIYKDDRVILVKTDTKLNYMPLDLELINDRNGYYTIVTAIPKALKKEKKIKGTLVYDESAPTSTAPSDGTLLDGKDVTKTGNALQHANEDKQIVPFLSENVSQNATNVNTDQGGIKKESLIYSSPRLDADTTSNGSAVTRLDGIDVGAANFIATSDKSNDSIADNVSQNQADVNNEATVPRKIKDFGEKIGGARKDVYSDYLSAFEKTGDSYLIDNPLSKSWPHPDYQKMLDEGVDKAVVDLVRSIRDSVKSKPRSRYSNMDRWLTETKTLRNATQAVLRSNNPTISADVLVDKNLREQVLSKAKLYASVGHDNSLAGISFTSNLTDSFHGERFAQPKRMWRINAPTFSDFTNIYADSEPALVEKFKTEYSKVVAQRAKEHETFLAEKAADEERVAQLKKDGGELPAPTVTIPESIKKQFGVYREKVGDKLLDGFYIGVKPQGAYSHPVVIKDGFKTSSEAFDYRRNNMPELVDTLKTMKELPAEYRDTNSPRVGEDMRKGKDVTPELFGSTFGFRGVEFGNWVENERRQTNLNATYDALIDLAGVLGISPKALSLNGELGLAFGARGKGGKHSFNAHYEPVSVVINLTKERGAGSLAHEWWHAVDNYFSRMKGDSTSLMLNDADVRKSSIDRLTMPASDKVRSEMITAFGNVLKAIKNTDLPNRSRKLDNFRKKPYWATNHELGARAFSSYVIDKLKDNGASNDYLANIRTLDEWITASGNEENYPFPTLAELPTIKAAFDNFFNTVKEKETDKGVAMYSVRQSDAEQKLSDDEKAWLKAIDNLGANVANKALKMMETPLVMQLIGVNKLPIVMHPSKVRRIKKEHVEMTDEMLKQLPRAIANPIAILPSSTVPGSIVIVTELESGRNGANVIVSMVLDKHADEYQANIITSAYAQENKSETGINEKWFKERFESDKHGVPLYLNEQKIAKWYQSHRLQLPGGEYQIGYFFDQSISNENDLVNFKNQIPEEYSAKQLPTDEQLKQDEKNWSDDIDAIFKGTLKHNSPIKMMQTPLALKLAKLEDLPIVMHPSKLKRILKEHPEMSPDILKQIPSHMADPMAIFSSDTVKGRVIVALELTDSEGSNVVVPLELSKTVDEYDANIIASAYGKISKKWFIDTFENKKASSNPLYLNNKKITNWYLSNRLQLPYGKYQSSDFFEQSIPNENDLVNLKTEYPNEYSVNQDSFGKMLTVDELVKIAKESIPNATNISVEGDTISLELPNGRRLIIDLVDEILATPEQLVKAGQDHGVTVTSNKQLQGSMRIVGLDGILQLTKDSEVGTIDHEIIEFAIQVALTEKEKSDLNRIIPDKEKQCDEYRERQKLRKQGRDSRFGKLWQKIEDFATYIKAFFGNLEAKRDLIFEKVASGEVWNRDIKNTIDENDSSKPLFSLFSDSERHKWQRYGKKFRESVAGVIVNKISGNTILTVCDTPLILQELGIPNLPIKMRAGIAANTTKPEKSAAHAHGLTLDMLEQIPQALNEPIFVMKSATHEGDMVVFTDVKDSENRSVIVPIAMQQDIGRGKVANVIKTIYGRNVESLFIARQLEKGNVLYANTEKSLEWLGNSRLQLPQMLTKQSSLLEKSIAEKLQKVNGVSYSLAKENNPWISKVARAALEASGKDFVDVLKTTAKDKKTLSMEIKLTEAPDILLQLGVQDSPITISRGLALNVMKKENTAKHAHELTYEMLEQLPLALNEPVFVMKSNTRTGDSIVVFTDIKDGKDRSIIVPIVINPQNNKLTLNPNWISSVYGRNSEDTFFVKQYLNGNILYANTEKSPAWASSQRLQLPKALLKQSSLLEKSVAQKLEKVNEKSVDDISYSIRSATENLAENLSNMKEGKTRESKATSGTMKVERMSTVDSLKDMFNRKQDERVEIRESKKPKSTQFGFIDHFLRSPSYLAEKFPQLKGFFRFAEKAMQVQEKLRSDFDRGMKRVYGHLKNKDEHSIWQGLLWNGDTLGKDYTRSELEQDGYSENVIKAYLQTRELIKKAYHLLNDARKKVTQHQKVLTKAKLDDLKNNIFAEILKVEARGDGEYIVVWKEQKTWLNEYTVSKEVLEDMKNGTSNYLGETASKYQIISIKPDGKGEYVIKTREGMRDIANRAGYIPHFFHDFFVMKKSDSGKVNEEGEVIYDYAVVGSGRTMNDAYAKAEKYLVDNPAVSLVIQPKVFKFENDESVRAAIVGDTEYKVVMERISKDMEMTPAQVQDMLDGKLKVKGRRRFFGNLLRRKGAEGFENDMDWVLRHYFNATSRYVALEEFKPSAIGLFERYFGRFDNDYTSNPIANYAKQYINDINGNPSVIENYINNFLNNSKWFRKHIASNFGDRAALQVASTITGGVSILKLGFFNVSSALLNLSQLMNTVGLLGEFSPVAGGMKNAIRPGIKEMRIFKETGIMNDITMDTTSGYNRFSPRNVFGKTMYFFRTMDMYARQATVLAAYHKAKMDGKNHAESIAFAKEVNRKANFSYGVEDAPNVFRRGSVFSQIALQFKKYPIKELELMYEITSKGTTAQKAKFWGTYFLLCGLLQVPMLDWLDDIFQELFGESPKLQAKKWIMDAAGGDPMGKELARMAIYGIGAVADVDISSRAGVGDVSFSADKGISNMLGGASYSTAKEGAKAIAGFIKGYGSVLHLAKALSPAMANYIQAGMGYTEGKRGRKNTDLDNAYDAVLKAAGFRNVEESVVWEKQQIFSNEKSEHSKARQRVMDMVLSKQANKEKIAPEDVKELRRLGVTGKQLDAERQNKRMSAKERLQKSLSDKDKARYRRILQF